MRRRKQKKRDLILDRVCAVAGDAADADMTVRALAYYLQCVAWSYNMTPRDVARAMCDTHLMSDEEWNEMLDANARHGEWAV